MYESGQIEGVNLVGIPGEILEKSVLFQGKIFERITEILREVF